MENEVDISLVKAKSSYHLPRNRSVCLGKTNFSCNNKSNLTKAEWKDFLALKNNSELIIKEADKVGSVILMNKPHYKKNNFSTFKLCQHLPKMKICAD